MARELLFKLPSMQPIESHELTSVRGGFGALLGPLLNAAGPILNGVAGIIGASKSGGGGGGTAAAPPPAGAPAPAAAPPPSAASSGSSSTGGCGADGLCQVITNVSITR